jgi:tetratricopeptide (TPR) repeat protein
MDYMMTDSRIIKVLMLLIVAGTLALISGCGGGGTNPPPPATLNDAWDEFEDGDYSTAIDIFHDVLSNDSSLTEGYTGLGWSFAFDYYLDSAEAYLDIALGRDPNSVDALALLSAVKLAQTNRTEAIDNATDALDEESNWSFDHYTGIDYLDLHLILAEAYFGQGESSFALAQTQVDILDPTNGLDPEDSDTWDGHASYAAALLMTIQEIEADIGLELML